MQMKFLKRLVAAVLLASAAWAEAHGACRTGVDWRHVGAGMGGGCEHLEEFHLHDALPIIER